MVSCAIVPPGRWIRVQASRWSRPRQPEPRISPSSLTTSQLAYGPTARSAYTRGRAALRNGANPVETHSQIILIESLVAQLPNQAFRLGMGGQRMQETGIRVAVSYCCGPTLPIIRI